MSERYIFIPSWDKHQHYKDQTRPAWIKLHTSLLHDDEWLNLTPGERSALIGIWILYAKTSRHVTADARSISRQIGQRVTSQTLAALNHAGFIEFRSRDALEKVYAREEKRRKEPPSIPPTGSEWERARKAEDEQLNGKTGYVHNLNSYTGVRIVRGETGIGHVYDTLGTEPKPQGWPHQTPSRAEIVAALKERAVA